MGRSIVKLRYGCDHCGRENKRADLGRTCTSCKWGKVRRTNGPKAGEYK